MKSKQQSLVVLGIGWSRLFVLPVQDATVIVTALVNSGAVRVDTRALAGTTCFIAQDKLDVSIQDVQHQFIADWPVDDIHAQSRYEAYLKLKRELLGDSYQIETYTQYQQHLVEGDIA